VGVDTEGFLSAAVYDDADTDVDVHILDALDPDACLDRGDRGAGADVSAGYRYVVADTWVDDDGPQEGPYTLEIGFIEPSAGDCEMLTGVLERISGPDLDMPATGPIVMEAHLVTVDDGYGTEGGGDWPQSIDENIDSHYALSQDAVNFVMHRTQSWAPRESSEYGQAAYYHKLPVEDEGWYVNMYWSERPDAGTRMIVQAPDGRAVVAAAGYETGPGDPDHIGGVTEEIHHYLGTGHLDELTLGFAADEDLPLGPISCE